MINQRAGNYKITPLKVQCGLQSNMKTENWKINKINTENLTSQFIIYTKILAASR